MKHQTLINISGLAALATMAALALGGCYAGPAYGAYSYSTVPVQGQVYYQGGYYNNVYYRPGYYHSQAPFIRGGYYNRPAVVVAPARPAYYGGGVSVQVR